MKFCCYFSAAKRIEVVSLWTVDHILLKLTCLQLICEKSIKQNAASFRCPTLADVRAAITRRQNKIIEYLVALADDSDQYVRYVAARALATFFVMLKMRFDRAWLDALVQVLETRSQPHRMLFSLDVLRYIIEWKVFDILEDCFPGDEIPPIGCECDLLQIHPERFNSSEVKCLCLESLAPKWTRVVNQFAMLMRDQTTSATAYRSCIICFLNLWKSIISVDTRLPITEVNPFYCSLDSSVSLLSNSVTPLIWKHILSLFNETLCYGRTFALELADLAAEPCSLAHVIVRHVKDRRLLKAVPHISGAASFGGGTNNGGDKILLKKIVLMILKAVAVTIKEAKYDSSSDSSASSDHEDGDRDMDMISRSIYDVLKKLDIFVKENEDFHPSTRLASWIVHLFIGCDKNFFIESMVCCLDVARVLCYRSNNLPELRKDLNPSETFLTFLNATSFNVDLLVGYLKEEKTCFLIYIINFLKYLRDQWGEFIETCKYELPTVGKLLRELRFTIEREVEINQITYDVSPVLSLLVACEQRLRLPE